ncbi:MAG: MBL fold hydrolase [Candidatus Harrisonbacteria bacterium CG10_big_fil_rev_8_21_14_0_10_42_17]|uniref:MBL fold hydrolase n=1 Tax=Candidatus Harrisonbacteria bacterium CG10_big_fil_rev_8_21_14_0_10_42_17 TaxID=1974584 RepID=A0A2M6WIW5_9BACT|nr:MAG: MBL fold hydrolase [Candidatus Harrisonbacteria bacterium CG10_big_fil_rev_8_21_14_0_10_42_17]
MKLTFFGGVKEVTGSNYLLESGGTRILVDCGLHQGRRFCEKHNWEPFGYDPASIDAVFLTHAHIDHSGRLPKLYREGFRGTVFSTPPTRAASEFLLADSDRILEREAEQQQKPILYNHDDLMGVLSHWKGIPYHEPVAVGSFKVSLYNAGHVLGSSIIVVEVEGKRIAFSGDMGNSLSPLLGATEILEYADYCLIESTYGGRLHDTSHNRKDILEDVIEDTVTQGGTLMIPAFAMERTQELLYELNDLVEHKRIPRIPIYIDSPLAIKLTRVYKQYQKYFDSSAQKLIRGGEQIFNFPGLHLTEKTEESKAINAVAPPKIIIAGSGMSHGGRILHHERRYLPDPKSTLLIIGYQGAQSLGRRLLDGAETVTIFGESVSVRARVRNIGGYSAHADQAQLLAWLKPLRKSLKNVFVVQGEESQSEALLAAIQDQLAIHAEIPQFQNTYVL